MTEAKIKLRVVGDQADTDSAGKSLPFRVNLLNPFRCWASLTEYREEQDGRHGCPLQSEMWSPVGSFQSREEAEENLKGLQKFLEAHKDDDDFEWIVRYAVSEYRTHRPLTSLQLEQGAKASKAETLKKISEDFKCTFVEDENGCTIKFGREPKLYPGDEKMMKKYDDFEPFEVMFFGTGEWGPFDSEDNARSCIEDEVYESFITYEVK